MQTRALWMKVPVMMLLLAIGQGAAACEVELLISSAYVPKDPAAAGGGFTMNRSVGLTICIQGSDQGWIALESSDTGGEVTFWLNLQGKWTEVEGVEASDCPIEVAVQGVDVSAALNDVTITATWEDIPGHLGDDPTDTENVSVVDLTFTRCGVFMPKGGSEDNNKQFTLYITPFQFPATTCRFVLYDVSDEPGYCMNKPSTVPDEGEDSDSWKDLQFEDQTNWTIAGANRDVATRVVTMGLATAIVTCYDYGAYGRLKAQIYLNDTWYTGHLRIGPYKEYATIPQDDDNNHVSDYWQHNGDGDAGADDDVSLNNTHHGDGLSLYEEYRGVDIDDNGIISASERLDPMLKDLFVQGTGFGGGFPDFGFGAAFSEAEIIVHEFAGTVGTDDRNIDVLVVTVQDQGDHIERHDPVGGARYWTPDTLGDSDIGDATDYEDPNIYKRAHNYFFSDKPYVDGKTWSGVGQWNNPPNGVLDPLDKVEDANDNGVLDALPAHNETDGAVTPPPDDGDGDFDGDYPKKVGGVWTFDNDLNPCDIDDDGKVEISGGEYTKSQVVHQSVTHEMGHAVGINGPEQGHCNDPTCVMYKYDKMLSDHFCNACRAMILIHNK